MDPLPNESPRWSAAGGLLIISVPVLLLSLVMLWMDPRTVERQIATYGFMAIGGGMTVLVVGAELVDVVMGWLARATR